MKHVFYVSSAMAVIKGLILNYAYLDSVVMGLYSLLSWCSVHAYYQIYEKQHYKSCICACKLIPMDKSMACTVQLQIPEVPACLMLQLQMHTC